MPQVWITRDALSDGIFSIEAEIVTGRFAKCQLAKDITSAKPKFYNNYEWYATREEAIFRAEKMREQRIRSLEKALKKMRELSFREKKEG